MENALIQRINVVYAELQYPNEFLIPARRISEGLNVPDGWTNYVIEYLQRQGKIVKMGQMQHNDDPVELAFCVYDRIYYSIMQMEDDQM
jgi:hypothetical protein